jgi:hypothetical protein
MRIGETDDDDESLAWSSLGSVVRIAREKESPRSEVRCGEVESKGKRITWKVGKTEVAV